MKIHKIQVGYLATNCYILTQGKSCLVIDPGDEIEKIEDVIQNYQLLAILITHHHFDHIGALESLLQKYAVPLYDYKQGEIEVQIGPFHFQILTTKGHTSDSVSFYFEEETAMFVGDFVFQNSIGRTDLETGNMKEMKESISKLKQYLEPIQIYPGHGESTTLKEEKEHNIYFK